jgi:hypothetical protein
LLCNILSREAGKRKAFLLRRKKSGLHEAAWDNDE